MPQYGLRKLDNPGSKRARGGQKIACFMMGSEQRLNPLAQPVVVPAFPVEKGGALRRLRDFSGGQEERFGAGRVGLHR